MAFEKKAPTWRAPGVEPPESKKQEGWQVNDKPPAAWWNWFMTSSSESIKELQDKAAEKTDITTINGEIDYLKQSGVDGKNLLETAIIAKEGTVSKQGQVATFAELDTGIRSIPTGTDTSDATAGAGDVLAPKTAYGPNGKITGTIPVLTGIRTATGAAKWPDGSLAVYPEKGYQKGGAGDGEIKVTTAQLQAAEANLNSNYILNGHPIFGVPGGIANRSAENHHMPGQDMTVWAGDRVFIAPPRGYYDGSSWVTAPATGIKPENLRDGVSFGPITGTLKTIGPGDKMRFFQDLGPTGLFGTTPQIAVGCTISVAGTYRVVFYLGVDDGLIGYGQIYVNGSPRGTLRSVTSSYIGYIEDISINGNDKIQVYAWTNQSGGGYVRLRDFTVSTDIEVWSSRT